MLELYCCWSSFRCGTSQKFSVGAWVLFLFVCDRVRIRVSVVWSPLGWGVVSCATAPVSWYFSAAQEGDSCQPLVPAGCAG